MNEKRNNKFGFTLIELLMVVAIILILTSIGWLATNQARVRARDSKRARDINQLYKAMEMYYSGEQSYPLNDVGLISSCDNNNWSNLLFVLKESPEAIDPINNTPYCYYYNADDENGAKCNNMLVGDEIGFIIGFKAEVKAPDTFGQLIDINSECSDIKDNCYCLADKL